MLSLSLITIGFLGIIALLSKSFFLTRVTSNEIVATYLASEGIELAKNLTDHDVYGHLAIPSVSPGWGTVWNNMVAGGSGTFEIDYTTCESGVGACSAPLTSNKNLSYNPVSHLYSYSGGASTIYKREIQVNMPAAENGNEIVVQSIVTWSTGPITNQSIVLDDDFYNWHP